MAVRNVTFEIPPGNHLSCISCDEVFKDVTDAIEHTVVCRKKNRLANKYQGVDQIEKIKGSVIWTQTNIAHLLNLFKKKVIDLGKAKAHYRTYELGKVHDEITSDLANLIGPGITHYQVTRKWNLLQKRALQYERLRKKQIKEGLLPSDPPSFHPSVKEIMRCVEQEKIKYLKEMEHSDKSYTLKIGEDELEIPEELCVDKDHNFEFPEGTDGDSGPHFLNEDGESVSMVIKRSSVLSIINQLEEGILYSKIMEEFGLTESVLSAIEQNREAIAQGAQRCSLCHILLSTNDDVVAHEIKCSRTYQPCKDINGSALGTDDEPFIGFLPETVNQLVDTVLNWYPKFTKGVNWIKVASHLSRMQSGVTAGRCSQKWHNLIAKCRKYQRLDKWATKNDYSHNNPHPDFYSRLIPYAESPLEIVPSQESIQKFLCIGSYANKINSLTALSIKKRNLECDDSIHEEKESSTLNDDGSEDYSDEDEELGSSILSTNSDDLDGNISNEGSNNEDCDLNSDLFVPVMQIPEISSKLSTSKTDMKSTSVVGNNTKRRRKLMKHKNCGNKPVVDDSNAQVQHIHQLETKLDDVLGLLGDVVKENQRLTKAEMKRKNKSSQEDIAKKLEKLTQVFITTHRQNLKHFQLMTKMWERHHHEHQAMMKSLISEISSKKKLEPEKAVKKRKK